jgi:hypothetical protein
LTATQGSFETALVEHCKKEGTSRKRIKECNPQQQQKSTISKTKTERV